MTPPKNLFSQSLFSRAFGQKDRKIAVSFEFFPPKSPEMERSLWAAIERLSPLSPQFVSVTYGAGGSTRERTHRTVKRMLDETTLKPAAHLTCVDASKSDVDSVIDSYWEAGVRHIVALRGDPAGGIGANYVARLDGYAHATELVSAIKSRHDFEISVGIYPEGHPQSPDIAFDLDVLRQKIDAGATRGISQFFFEPETYLRFRDKVADKGLKIELLPGIMPVTNFKGLIQMAKACKTHLPEWLYGLFAGLDEDLDTRKILACAIATDLVLKLEEEGVENFHFYTLNRADLVYALCRALGLKEDIAQKDLSL